MRGGREARQNAGERKGRQKVQEAAVPGLTPPHTQTHTHTHIYTPPPANGASDAAVNLSDGDGSDIPDASLVLLKNPENLKWETHVWTSSQLHQEPRNTHLRSPEGTMAGLFVLSKASSILKNLEKHASSHHQSWLTFRLHLSDGATKENDSPPIFFPFENMWICRS